MGTYLNTLVVIIKWYHVNIQSMDVNKFGSDARRTRSCVYVCVLLKLGLIVNLKTLTLIHVTDWLSSL